MDLGPTPVFLRFALLLSLLWTLYIPSQAQLPTSTESLKTVLSGTPYVGLAFAYSSAGDNLFVNTGTGIEQLSRASNYAASTTLASGYTQLQGLAFDGNNLYFIDAQHHTIDELQSSNNYLGVTTIVSGSYNPISIAVDLSGNLLFLDANTNTIYEHYGSFNTVGSVVSGFTSPVAIAYDVNNRNLFVADNGYVKEVPFSTTSYTYGTPRIVGGSAKTYPNSLALDINNNLFFSTTGSPSAIQELPAATNYASAHSLPGLFTSPFLLALALDGSLYVQDAGPVTRQVAFSGADSGPVSIGQSVTAVSLGFTFNSTFTLGSETVLPAGNYSLKEFTDAKTGSCVSGTTYTAGQTCTVDVTFTPAIPGTRYGAAELLDPSLNVAATAYLQGTGLGPQIAFSNPNLSTISTLAGFQLAENGNGALIVAEGCCNVPVAQLTPNGTGYTQTTVANLIQPYGAAVDAAGNIYIADTYTGIIYKESPLANGTYAQTVLDQGFNKPFTLAVDGSGDVFVGDTFNNQIVEEIYSNGKYTRYVFNNGDGPYAMAVDGAGNLYTADYSGNIKVYTLALPPSANFGIYYYLETPITTVPVTPYGLTLDPVGNIYVSNTQDGLILKETPSSGSYTQSTLLNGIFFPAGLAVDPTGNFFVADTTPNGYYGQIQLATFSNAPTLNFGNVPLNTSTSQTITLSNNGNAPLLFPIPTNGSNPQTDVAVPPDAETPHPLTSSYSVGSGSTCPVVTSTSTSEGSLAPGKSCTFVIDFSPTTTGPAQFSLAITDNTLNKVTTQTVAVTAMATPPAPAVQSISPSFGPDAGGTHVSITGSAFTGATAVAFGNTPAASFTVVNDSLIQVTAPAGSPGQVDVTVTTSGGTSPAKSGDAFTYNPAPGTAQMPKIFVASHNGSVSALNDQGTLTQNQAGHGGSGVAIDPSGQVWSVDADGGGVSTLDDAGNLLMDTRSLTATQPAAIAIDSSGDVWFTSATNSIQVLSNTGAVLHTATSTVFNNPSSLSIDISGNVWVAQPNNTVVEVLGAASPTKPIAAGAASGTPAARP